MFLYAVIVPVIPFAIQTRSHVKQGKVQYWVSVLIAIYAAALLAFSPVCGWLADRSSSRRSPLLIGLVALLGATVLLNVGSSIGILIVGRLLQGTSAAVVYVHLLLMACWYADYMKLGSGSCTLGRYRASEPTCAGYGICRSWNERWSPRCAFAGRHRV